MGRIGGLLLGGLVGSFMGSGLFEGVVAEEHSRIPLPSYHYGAKIPVSCLNRSMYVLVAEFLTRIITHTT